LPIILAMRPRLAGGLVLLLVLLPLTAAAQPAVVEGQVLDATSAPVSYANVRLAGSADGAATDTTGRFRFRTRQHGTVTLRASAVGHETAEQTVRLAPGDTTTVQLALSSSQVQLDEAVVTGTYSTGPSETTTLDPTEAVTTPGAAGDFFRALQAFPGVAAPGDGAGLFVRGGDVTETKVLLDQATVQYPYRYESPAGGTFGAVPPFLVDGTQFSMGGFSAEYGNALSGVLAMESQDRPTQARQYLNLGLAAASLSIDQPLIEDELGIRVSGNRSFTGVLFRVNGERDDYTTVPQGIDGNVGLTWDYSDTGQLKFFAFARHNRIGVETTEGAYSGVYRSEETSQLYNLQWTAQAGRWTVESSASGSIHTTEKGFGALDLTPTDASAKLRVDATRTTENWTVRTGGTVKRRRYQFEGTLPTQPEVVSPGAPTRSVEETLWATRGGGYAELVSSVFSPLTARIGVRTDHQSRAGGPTVDPRVALSWQFSSHTRLRAAWGLYHQFPELATHSEHLGENSLDAQRAQHVVLGLRHERDDLLLRAEAYHKPYRDLVVRTGDSRFANTGTGFAQGVDLFAKYGAFLETRFNGWASYSLLRSRRTQARDRGRTVQLEQGPAPFDLTHQITAVGKVRVIDGIRVGGTYRYTTGQPFTPVVGRVQLDSGAFLPVDGPVGSERLPAYHRLDLQMSYFWPFNRQQNVVVYAALNNALDRANVVDVTYSPDYSERRDRTTDFRRSVYVGLTLTL
jgi:hypothetical protein